MPNNTLFAVGVATEPRCRKTVTTNLWRNGEAGEPDGRHLEARATPGGPSMTKCPGQCLGLNEKRRAMCVDCYAQGARKAIEYHSRAHWHNLCEVCAVAQHDQETPEMAGACRR